MHHKPWKIDRHVPVAVIVVLLSQLLALIVWATQLEARVGDLETRGVEARTLPERFARLEERLDGLKEDITGIKRQLDRLAERMLKP